MPRKQKNKKPLPLEILSATPKKFNKFLNKKRARFLSRLFFYASFSKRHKQQFLVKYMWILTHRKLFALEERNTDQTNWDHWLSMKYLRISLKYLECFFSKKDIKIKKNVKTKKDLKTKKYLEEYQNDFLKSFHEEENSRVAIRRLRQTLTGKLPFFFFQPWKKSRSLHTRKQHWLKTTYSRYQTLRFKDRIDFFRTYVGQMLLNTYWRSYPDIHRPLSETYLKYSFSHTQGWWYENLVQKMPSPKSAKRFVLNRPKTAFQIHWAQEKLEPWKNILLFKRALYAGFGEDYRKENRFQPVKIKNYLRSKNPRREKRNFLYARANILWNNFRQRYRIRADKFARLKQVASKIVLPFYGHLRPRQMKRILTKSKKIKSKFLGFHEIILSHFENRLDVTVYRLNLAPSILWARRLIKAGLVFVTTTHNSLLWESMYHGLKKFAFPLKLRDPKNLYTKTYWTYNQENWVEFKFLGQPKRKISYLLQTGDLIQCAAGTYLNHFKTQSWLCRKPIPAHLLVQKKKTYAWDWHLERFRKQTFNTWEQSSDCVSTAIFLHAPQYRDLDARDRIKESFLRWAML